MEYPLAQWCRKQLDADPREFYRLFVAEHAPTTGDVAELALWMHKAYPECHLRIQDFLWQRLVDTDSEIANKVNTTAFVAFQARRRLSQEASIAAIRASQSDSQKRVFISQKQEEAPASEPANIRSLLTKHFAGESFMDTCRAVLGELPNENLPFDDALLAMMNILVFRLAASDRERFSPATIQEYAASFIAGVELSHDQMCIDGSGRLTDSTDLMNDGRRVAEERAKNLHQKFSHVALRAKDQEGQRRRAQLLSLCSFLQEVFADVRVARAIDQPIRTFIDVQPTTEARRFPAATCCAYLQGCLNSCSILREVFGGIRVESALSLVVNSVSTVQDEMRKASASKPHPADLVRWIDTLQVSVRNLELQLRPLFDNPKLRPKKHWMFPDGPLRDCMAVCVTVCQPLLATERQLVAYVSDAEVMQPAMRNRLLPEASNLVRNLTHLYERRLCIAGYLDEIRRRTRRSPLDLLQPNEQKGHCLQETLDSFATDSSRMELSKLITRLKLTRPLESARTGHILTGISCLKRALPDYLDQLLEDSLGDAEETLAASMRIIESVVTVHTLENDPVITEILAGMQMCIKDTGEFLEAVTWLKDYIARQRTIWNEEIYVKPVPRKAKTASSTKTARQRPPKSKQLPEAKQPAPTAVSVESPAQIEPEITVSSTSPILASSVPVRRPVNTWKVHAAQMRAMHDLARRARRLSNVSRDDEQQAIREVLEGALRRRTPEQLAWLNSQKVSVILEELLQEGWSEDHINGDHHIFKHCVLRGILVIPYTSTSDQLRPGTFNSIAKMAGWK